MKKLIYLTNNIQKFHDMNKYFIKNYGLNLEVIDSNYEILDVQAKTCSEAAAHSVKDAADKLNCEVIKSNTGLYLEALGGLPGPFNKYFYKQIGEKKFLELLKNEKNRKARLEYCLAYCEPGSEPVVFIDVETGTVTNKLLGKKGKWYDLFYMPDGETKTLGELNKENYDNETSSIGNAKDRFAKWYIEKNKNDLN